MNKKNEKYQISIVLPFHRLDKLFFDALDSCYKSKDCLIEILLVDTRTKIESNNSLALNLPKFVKLINASGCSYMEALAIGINNSRTDYIALMNSDDLIATDRFVKQLGEISVSNSDVCICNIRKFSKNPKRKIPATLGDITDSRHYLEQLLLGSYGADATWLFKRLWAKKNNVFQDPNDVSDWSTAMRVFKDAKICKVDEELYFYRMHNLQTSKKSSNNTRLLERNLQTLNSYLGLPEISTSTLRYIAGLHRPNYKEFFSNNFVKFPSLWFASFESRLAPISADLSNIIKRRKLLFSISNIRNLRYFNIWTAFCVAKDLILLRNKARW